MEWLAVFLGGGFGSLLRFSIARLLNTKEFSFSWATPLANFLSCILLGILMTVLLKSDHGLRLFWMVGFCGGFSTFSTFTAESFHYMQQGQWLLVGFNILGSIVMCLAGYLIGLRMASGFIE